MKRQCLNPDCGKEFKGRRDAETCSPRCRMALWRLKEGLSLRTIHALPPQAKQMLEEVKTVSPRAYHRILEVVKTRGAGMAEPAIYAAFEAAHDCITLASASQ